MNEITWVRLDLLPFVGMFAFDSDEDAGRKIKEIARAFATNDTNHPYVGPMLEEAKERHHRRVEAGANGGKTSQAQAKLKQCSSNAQAMLERGNEQCSSNAQAMVEQCSSNAQAIVQKSGAMLDTIHNNTVHNIEENTDPPNPPSGGMPVPVREHVQGNVFYDPLQAIHAALPGIETPEPPDIAPRSKAGDFDLFFPEHAELQNQIRQWIQNEHSSAKLPKPGTSGHADERKAIEQLIRLDGFTADDIRATLKWAFEDADVSAGNFAWRDHIQSVTGLRDKKKGATMNKFAKIHEASKRSGRTTQKRLDMTVEDDADWMGD